MVKQNQKLPNEIVKFKSSDKEHHQKPDYEDLANCCTPVFCVISGNVNCGKTSLLKNLLVHKNPYYERIVIYSPLGEATTEYSDVIEPCELIDFVPEFDFFDKDVRNCFIVEDCDTKSLGKDERYKLGRFFGVYSSHNNIDIYVISQNVFDLLPQIRRLANIIFLFKNNDLECMKSLARKFSVRLEDLKIIFNKFTKYDSLCIDDSRDAKYRYRKNIFEILDI